MELAFIILVIVGGIYLYIRNKNLSAYIFDENAIVIYKKNQLRIEFDKIKLIERHYAASFQFGAYIYTKYFFSYINEYGEEKEATLMVSSAEFRKWRGFKEKLLAKNPGVKFRENVL